MLVIPSLRHCSNKYKLAREGINKEKTVLLFRMKSSSVERDEFSVVALKIDRDPAFRMGGEDHSTGQEW